MRPFASFFGCLTLASVLGAVVPAHAQYEEDAFRAIERRLEQQEEEIRRLRALLDSPTESQAPRPEPFRDASYFQDRAPTGIEQRLKALEEQLQQAAEEEKQKQQEEQEKKEEAALQPSVKPRMRLHTDASWFDQSPQNRATLGDIQDGIYIRRARLGFDAKAFEVTQYRLDFEMSSGGGRPSIFDAYMRVTELPLLQNVQVGHFREPFSLEAQTSSNWYTFIERAPITTFDPSRNWGVMTFGVNETESATWAVGVFREGSDDFGDDIGDTGERAATARLTWLPYYDEPSDGRYYFHVGMSGSYRDPDKDDPGGIETSLVRFAARPEVNLNEDGVGGVPSFVDTGLMADASDLQQGGLEAAWVMGPLSIQGEYIGTHVDRTVNPSPWLHGAYIQASYFLTGEHRPYNREQGTFDRTDPFEPFFRVSTDRGICTGRGAWEIAARWSYIDMNDGGLNGGYLDDTNLGVNWYMNPYARLMFNYIYADLHHPTDGRSNANIFLTRVSVWF